MPLNASIKKVLVIGSGPIVIGQAAEFDYAGAQACRVLKEAGVDVVLANSNPATIMTDRALADEIYLEPLTLPCLRRIIEKERPDSLLVGLGGQTGLTLAMQLAKEGFLEKMGVRLLGTTAEAIDRAEDRQLFRQTMQKLGQPVIPSEIACTVEEAAEAAGRIGYPIIIRPAFTLGGSGGGVAQNEKELREITATGLLLSPITQVLVERYIYGWKEIEFEVMRDGAGNVVAVCSMENFDPVGVHTGDSIVVAPAMTLSNQEYQMLRTASLDIITELGIQGGCNCQFALKPDSFEYAVIEVNPRVSRSSALASKATGYPIAKVTTKIALGYTLDEIKNEITGKTCACFEPALDYVVVKMPKWPFDKFAGSDRRLGTQMKATGEVMSIAPCFEMALLKAVRGAEIGLDTLHCPAIESCHDIRARLHEQDDLRLFTVFEALRRGVSIEEIYEITRIDPWFLAHLDRLARFEERLLSEPLTKELYHKAKTLGYPDAALCRLTGMKKLPFHEDASFHMVDTCAGEFAAQTPYFYSAHDGFCEAKTLPSSGKPAVLVLGSGPIRIGQGIEFDYSSVHCVWKLKEMGYDVAIINNNPETVSTDFDTADRLYFEPLTPEDVSNVIRVEKPVGVVAAFGGQTAIRLTQFLDREKVPILGTSAEGIDLAEDRGRFDALLESLSIKRPRGLSVMTEQEALAAAKTLGFPVLLRPSYVIGGQNMTIAHTECEVSSYMNRILAQGIENPVLIDQYLMGTELEVDVISDGKDVLLPGVMEHIERAGVHSGDSIAVYPPYNLNDKMLGNIITCSTKLALALGTKGLVNIQYLIYQNELYVIEVNPRASRTVPYLSKVTGVPMVDIASGVMLGLPLTSFGYGTGLYPAPPYCAVKVPVFSFEKLADVNSYLGPEMKSTGEVLGLGATLQEALFKGLTSAGIRVPAPEAGKETGVLISVDPHDRHDLMNVAKKLADLQMTLYATPETADMISSLGIHVKRISGIRERDDAFCLLESGKIHCIIYTGAAYDDTVDDYIALHRRALHLGIPCLTSLDTANALADTIASRFHEKNTELIDLNHLRKSRLRLPFCKMQGTGDDYIFFDNTDGLITCPEAMAILLCDRGTGIGGNGLVLMEPSVCADAKMRIYNRDGSEGLMAGNCIRSVAKYLYDSHKVPKEVMTIETGSGLRRVRLYCTQGHANLAEVEMGKADFSVSSLPALLPVKEALDCPVQIGEEEYRISCVSVGNPHCVVLCENVDALDLAHLGPKFEHAEIFPDRVNTEFIRVVDSTMIKMRVWERGNGETAACGTGACAAAAAAVRLGLCPAERDITVKVPGGDLIVWCSFDGGVTLTGETHLVYEGVVEY